MTELDAAALIAQHVPPPFFAEAVRAVDNAQHSYTDNQDRRDWCVRFLIEHLHCPEYLARLLTELAVAFVKTQRERGERT